MYCLLSADTHVTCSYIYFTHRHLFTTAFIVGTQKRVDGEKGCMVGSPYLLVLHPWIQSTMDVGGQLCAMYCVILHRGFEHLWIGVPVGSPRNNPHG